MRFFTVISVLACGVMALAAAVSPDALVSRDNAGITSVVTTLDQQCNGILPMLDSCTESGCVVHVVSELCVAIDTATAGCKNAQGLLDFSLALKITNIISNVCLKLYTHRSSCGGNCGDLSVYSKLDLSLSLLLKQLGVCISGLLGLVASLLFGVVGILHGLALNLTLKACLLL